VLVTTGVRAILRRPIFFLLSRFPSLSFKILEEQEKIPRFGLHPNFFSELGKIRNSLDPRIIQFGLKYVF